MRDEVITHVKIRQVPTFILPDNLFNELFGFRDLKFRKHSVFDVLILTVKALYCTLLHLSEAIGDIDTALLNLSPNHTVFDQLLYH